MFDRVNISSKEMADWIKSVGDNSLMLTIGELHASFSYTKLDLEDMEPIVSRIIDKANKNVFGKNKHFEYLNGIVVQEIGNGPSKKNKYDNPHFHILLIKPNHLDFEKFKYKLLKVEEKFSNKFYGFYITDSASLGYEKSKLAVPCYDRFVRVTDTHELTGKYLTKSYKCRTFILTDRGVHFQRNEIKVYFDNAVKDMQHKGELFMQLGQSFINTHNISCSVN